MNTMTFFANTELPPRVALTAGHRGYGGMREANLPLAQQLSRSAGGAAQLADTAALAMRGEEGAALYKV